jgi:amino acid permease
MMQVGHSAVAICLVIYLSAGIFGYLTFASEVEQDLLKSYNSDARRSNAAEAATAAMYTLYCVAISCTVPLQLFPARKTLTLTFLPLCCPRRRIGSHGEARRAEGSAPEDPPTPSAGVVARRAAESPRLLEDAAGVRGGSVARGGKLTFVVSTRQHLLTGYSVIAVVLLTAMFVPNIEDVIGLSGAIASVSLVFILPPIFFFRISTARRSRATRAGALALLVLGVLVFASSMTGIILSWTHPNGIDPAKHVIH